MITEQERRVLQELRGKDVTSVTQTDYYWLVSQVERLQDVVDAYERDAAQRAVLRARHSSLPPAEGASGPG